MRAASSLGPVSCIARQCSRAAARPTPRRPHAPGADPWSTRLGRAMQSLRRGNIAIGVTDRTRIVNCRASSTSRVAMIQSKLPKVGTTIFTVMSQLAQEHGAVNLGQGFPDFPVPARLVEELDRAMREGHNQYAPMTGVPALRQAIAAKSARVYGHRPDADAEVTVTSGATEAIFNAIHAVVRAGDEVIVLDPCYDCYEPAIDLAGARAVHVPLDPATFAPDWQRVRDAIGPRTRMLMINSPHNPSGAMFSADDMRELEAILDGTGILLL